MLGWFQPQKRSGLATPLWSDSEFKTLLGEQMDLIVTEKLDKN